MEESSRSVRTAPLGEVFGYRAQDKSPEAQAARESRTCRFRGKACNKAAGGGETLGVCSLLSGSGDDAFYEPVCPSRFLDGRYVEKELNSFLLDGGEGVLVSEGRLNVRTGEGLLPAGSVDWVLVDVKDGKMGNYGAVEFQAVYTTGGGVRKAFQAFMEGEDTPEQHRSSLPDYRSSGRKRLTPQLQAKGKVFADNGIKQAVVLSQGLYDSEFKDPLKSAQVPREEADFVWLVVKATPESEQTLQVSERLYTTYTKALVALQDPGQPDLELFENNLLRKLEQMGALKCC